MRINRFETTHEMAEAASAFCVNKINEAIEERGEVSLLVSTGASQIAFLEELVKADVDWSKVTLFHLDEYIALPEEHPASFRRYIRERILNKVGTLKEAYLVDGNADPAKEIARLTEAVRRTPIDIGLIGIGENAHVAFNDPPADFATKEAFHVVKLDQRCKSQQVEEGWFETIEDVPKEAISATVSLIMSCRTILSIVPYKAKAEAVRNMYDANTPDPMIPASILKTHHDFNLFLDRESASLLAPEV